MTDQFLKIHMVAVLTSLADNPSTTDPNALKSDGEAYKDILQITLKIWD